MTQGDLICIRCAGLCRAGLDRVEAVMTDRELLELAAKAAGYDVVWATDLSGFVFRPFGHGPRTMFRPLTDDGDALRVAVVLGMNVFHAANCAFALDEDGDVECREPHGNEKFAATRRAIVRAAAEIGKAMP